ncbi:MAG: sugar phosphate isomerase/epimerase [Clostridia bacterium]|nr:sugar phosphate isomerase/epimerase [Clostridia bacterium]
MSELFLKPSIASAYYKDRSPEEMVRLFLEAGFFHTELAYEHTECLTKRAEEKGESLEKIGRDFRRYFEDLGFSVPQAHLSFLPGILTDGMADVLKRQIVLFDALGVQNAVLHLSGDGEADDEARHQKILPILSELVSFAEGSGVCLCIENLYKNTDTVTVEGILRYLDETPSEHLGICLDTGHLHLANARGLCTQSQRDFILRAGNRLKALHIANNDGSRDQHLLPFNGSRSIHWDEVLAALRQIGYQGIFNLEIGGETSTITCPFAVKELKIRYIRELMSYMLGPEFAVWTGNRPTN